MVCQKTRFEVFRRDGFTCQYCGRKSPEVVLEADHITPVSKGGSNDIGNLITSCRECNRGKQAFEIIPKKINYFEDSKKITHDFDALLDYAHWITTEMYVVTEKIKEKHIENYMLFYNYLDSHDGNFSEEDLKYKRPQESMEDFSERYLVNCKNKIPNYISEVQSLNGPNEILDYHYQGATVKNEFKSTQQTIFTTVSTKCTQ